MREIKFRGRSKDDDHWVYGDYVKQCTGETYIVVNSIFDEDKVKFNWIEVDPATVGQYTGLKDKNGKEIYEGDILRFPPKDKWEETSFIGYEVFYHDNDCADNHVGFQMNRLRFYGHLCGGEVRAWMLPKYTERMEVFANIYEHPHLLEGRDET